MDPSESLLDGFAACYQQQEEELKSEPGMVLDADLAFALDDAMFARIEIDDAIRAELHLPSITGSAPVGADFDESAI